MRDVLGNSHGNSRQRSILDTPTHTHILESNHTNHEKSHQLKNEGGKRGRTNNQKARK